MDKVWVFFYGTFMSAEILQKYGIHCEETIPAKLSGFELSIRPRVTLKKNASFVSYGGIAHISHADISQLYRELHDTFAITYYSYPVLVELGDEQYKPVLCYISFDIEDAPADPNYVIELAGCASRLGAPAIYIEHIKSFMSVPE